MNVREPFSIADAVYRCAVREGRPEATINGVCCVSAVVDFTCTVLDEWITMYQSGWVDIFLVKVAVICWWFTETVRGL